MTMTLAELNELIRLRKVNQALVDALEATLTCEFAMCSVCEREVRYALAMAKKVTQ